MKTITLRMVTAVATVIASCAVGAQPADTLAHGEIRKIDKAASKVTIKHGDIPSIEMPPMTMVFTVKDPTMLDVVKAGDKIRFDVVRDGGKLVVTRIESDK